MNDIQKLVAKMAAQFLVAKISAGGDTRDTAYALECFNLADTIVRAPGKQSNQQKDDPMSKLELRVVNYTSTDEDGEKIYTRHAFQTRRKDGPWTDVPVIEIYEEYGIAQEKPS